jgi:5-methylcytosine-specific restriction enzyme A
MPIDGPIRVTEITAALQALGGTAPVADLQNEVIRRRGGRPANYASDRTCKQTIQKLIEDHCPESANYSKEPLFERIAAGVYRLA